MKKAMVYILALTMAFSTLFAGCGEMRGTDGSTTSPTPAPKITSAPEAMVPDPADGVVEDRDGIITEQDNGNTAAEKRAEGATNGVVVPGGATAGLR